MSVGRTESIYEQKKNLKPNKEKKIEELEKTIKNIEKMDISEYLKYSKKKEDEQKKKDEEDNDDDESTIEEVNNKLMRIKKFEKEIKNIKYELEF